MLASQWLVDVSLPDRLAATEHTQAYNPESNNAALPIRWVHYEEYSSWALTYPNHYKSFNFGRHAKEQIFQAGKGLTETWGEIKVQWLKIRGLTQDRSCFVTHFLRVYV
jgi:hypothetical protein